MFKNYLKVAFRNLINYKGYSFINILGLSIGLAVSFVILLYVRFELSYENFHENKNKIYRVIPWFIDNGIEQRQTFTPSGLAPLLEEEFHEIKHASRFQSWGTISPLYNGKEMMEGKAAIADSTFVKMFSFDIIKGNPEKVLDNAMQVLISESVAEANFPDEDPIGKTITYSSNHFELEITGVFEDVPQNSHLQFSYLMSFATLEPVSRTFGNTREDIFTQLDSWNYSTYLFIPETGDINDLEIRASDLLDRKRGREPRDNSGLIFQPLTDIHFTQGIRADTANGNITYVYGFSIIGVFILVIACVNFMNLSTARAIRRAKEVGLRKVMGAYRYQLIYQFLGETILISCISLFLSFIFLETVLPFFSSILGYSLSFTYMENIDLILLMIGIGLLAGIFAGSYPAFYLSSFTPAKVMKNEMSGSKTSVLRKTLTLLQFAIASFLIIGTLAVFKQLEFMKNSKLGFDKEHVIYFSLPSTIRNNFETFKNNLLQYSGIRGVTHSNGVPGTIFSHYTYQFKIDGEDIKTNLNTLLLDENYMDVLGIDLKDGRGLSSEIASDSTKAYMINEAAAEEFNLEVGDEFEVLSQGRGKGRIIGIMKDFHYHGLQREIDPLAAWMEKGSNLWTGSVRLQKGGDLQDKIELIKNEWDKMVSGVKMNYSFLDESFDNQYRSEENMSKLLISFSVLTIFIACLGLLGLSAFTAEQRTKEIGIRKVMGATVSNVVILLSKDFGKLIIIAFIVVIPVSYYLIENWLMEFAYRINLGPGLFLIGAVTILVFALGTISYQSVKAAIMNPVDSLRNNE